MKTKIALMLFTLIIALGITGAVSATDGLTDKNCNTNYQHDNQDNWNKEDECNEKYNDHDYIKDNAGYAEPICDKCRNYEYRCKCKEEVKYDPYKSSEEKCDEKARYDPCRKTVGKCDKRPKYKKAAVGDLVWNDLNANGIQDANEPGIEGVTVNLWTNVNNAPGSIIKTTTTNATGHYLFTNLVPGTYWLQFLVPDALGEWIFALQNQGTDNTKDSDANASGIAGPICLKCGECDPNWDAGLYQYATLGDRVWMEIIKNGLQDPNEPGVAGVTVNLWTNVNNAPGSIIKTTTTNATGHYLFTNIVPGTYWLQFVLPDAISSWIFALQNQGTDDAIDSDTDANGIAGPIELASGEVDLTWDAGLDPGAAAGGDEEPTDGAAGGGEGAAGGEEVAAAEEEALGVTAAAGEPPTVSAAEVAMQETGMPINYLILALLMILGGLYGFRK